MKASIVYWYAGESLRRDGGGLRAIAWQEALEVLGYDVTIVPLWTIGGGVSRGTWLSRIKRSLIPMPFSRPIPESALNADLVVATVPAVFGSALKVVSHEKLVFDWMDLWSINSRNVGDASLMSRPGGILQSWLWRRRERKWRNIAGANAYAGYDDFVSTRSANEVAANAAWIPTPVELQSRVTKPPAEFRRIGFIGNLDYPPNQLSLRKFLIEFSASLEARNIEFVVAGFGSRMVEGWGFPVTVLGEVENSAEFYSMVDASVVPIEHGGGIKVKAVESLSFGLPVFGTEHVRTGFNPEFRQWILEITELFSGTQLSSANFPREEFEATFGRDAFVKNVSNLIRQM